MTRAVVLYFLLDIVDRGRSYFDYVIVIAHVLGGGISMIEISR